MTYGQGTYTKKYDVYGHPRGNPDKHDYLGYVRDYNSVYAREQATTKWRELGFTVTSVTLNRSDIRGR